VGALTVQLGYLYHILSHTSFGVRIHEFVIASFLLTLRGDSLAAS